jgi:hypothetical protein
LQQLVFLLLGQAGVAAARELFFLAGMEAQVGFQQAVAVVVAQLKQEQLLAQVESVAQDLQS